MRYGPTSKKQRNLKGSDPLDYGDAYSLTAIKPDTRLFIGHNEGKRTAEDAVKLFKDIERKRSITSPFLFSHQINGVPLRRDSLTSIVSKKHLHMTE